MDHGQRVSTGHAEGSLPTSQAQLEVLTNLVKRWTPEHLNQRRIDSRCAKSASAPASSSTACSDTERRLDVR